MKNQIIILIGLFLSTNLFAQTYSGGNGTENNPYLISSKADMDALTAAVNNRNNYSGKYFLLTTDIFEPLTAPIGLGIDSYNYFSGTKNRYFSGNFNGDGHVVYLDIRYKDSSSNPEHNLCLGLFALLKDAVIENIIVKGETYLGYVYPPGSGSYRTYSGGVAGFAKSSIIKNCISSVRITKGGAGGVCGWALNDSRILNCYSSGIIRATGNASNGNVNLAGGICAYSSGATYSCFAVMDTIAKNDEDSRLKVGRICAYNGNIQACYALDNMIIYKESSNSGSTVVSNNPASTDGKSAPFSSFQSQQWIEQNMSYIGEETYNWDFNNVWRMSESYSDYKGLPVLRNTKYPKSINVGSQIGILTQGTAGTAYFPIATANIVNNRAYSVRINNAPAGISSNNDLYIQSNGSTISISTSSNTPAGIYPITIHFDNIISNTFNLFVGNSTNIESVSTHEINLYPNPAKNYLYIQSEKAIGKIEVFNQTGECILINDNFTDKLDVSTLPEGWYLLRIYAKGVTTTTKIIVKH
jgi:hypothetical protein